MKRPVPFVWVDVFAEQPFGGNPLAVLDGSELPEEALLPLTRELNLAETTFFYPPSPGIEADARVRIFTHAKEIPYAGHPVLGTAVALLLMQKLAWKAPQTTVRLELGIGVVPVTVSGGELPERAQFSHSQISVPGSPISDQRLAWLPPALGLPMERFRHQVTTSTASGERTLYPQVANGGALQLIVPVESPEDIEQIEASYRDVVVAERALGAELGILAFAFVAPPRSGSPIKVRARFFAFDAPHEDPATGSAAASLAVYLHHHRVLQAAQVLEIDQGPPRGRIDGVPGRRSLLRAYCDGTSVQVEGRVREVLRGDMRLHM
jgi:trans-2,3-dihydro-3-hydroxyanthranilate isomerase